MGLHTLRGWERRSSPDLPGAVSFWGQVAQSAAHLLCHSTTVPGPCWATSAVSSLAGSLLTVSLSLGISVSRDGVSNFQNLCLSPTLSLAASLPSPSGPTLGLSQNLCASFSPRLSQHLSLSLCLCLSLSLTVSVSLCLPASLSLSPPRWFPLRLSRGPNSRPRIEFSGNKGK